MDLKIIAIFFLVVFRVNAQVHEFSVQEYPALIVKGQNMDIKISEFAGNNIRITGAANKNHWAFKNLSGKGLILEEILKDNRKDLITGLDTPKHKLIIQVPNIPVEISGYKVDVLVENVKKEVKVVSSFGSLRFIKTAGEMIVALNNGDVLMESHNGKLKLDGEQIKLNIKNSTLDGEYRVQNLKLDMDKTHGYQQVHAFAGNVNLNQNSGSYLIEMTKGALSSIANQGRLEAVMDEANTEVRLVKDNELNIKTKTGKVFINSNNVTGIWLNLKSTEGDVYLPNPLKPQKLKTENLFKGRTSGDKTLTRAEIKTINAPIIIK